ncbi:hypothetical protein MRB53_001833 [Persea americana]|uniref:Uncharacterized protein n=1 Tax=Persea americana TaxID=3435 RepID=A0ACC2MT38_PERAE|nr:hypothetical protein MRB53_001833 [Persea americana]
MHRQEGKIGAAEPILPWGGVCGLCLGIQATQELSVPRREVVGEIPADFSKEDIYARLCRPIPLMEAQRWFGWRRVQVGFACQFLPRSCQLPGLMIGDTGVEESLTLREIPVVVMSSESIPTRISKCLKEGAEEFLLKPLRPSDVSRLRNHMNHLGSVS